MRVHPPATKRQKYTQPLAGAKDLAFTVPANGQDKNSLEMADNVESKRRSAANDQKLRQVVHGGHNARCADRPEEVYWDCAEIRDSVEKGHKGNQQAHGDGGLVEEQLWRRYLEILNLLSNPNLVQRGRAEGESRNDDAKEGSLDLSAHGKRNTDASCQDSGQHPSGDGLAEDDEVDEDDSGCGHDLGQLVETDRVECQAEVAEDNIASEESADRHHVPNIQLHGLEGAEGTEGGEEEDEAGGGEMPHDDHQLALLKLRVGEHSVASSAVTLFTAAVTGSLPFTQKDQPQCRQRIY